MTLGPNRESMSVSAWNISKIHRMIGECVGSISFSKTSAGFLLVV